MTLSLANGQSVSVSFFDTMVAMSAITYNADCVPLAYTLTFNGDASFTPMLGALLAALAASSPRMRSRSPCNFVSSRCHRPSGHVR